MPKQMRSVLKARYILPAVYAAIALSAWLSFMRLPPDGLANLGLMVVALPAMLLDLALRSQAQAERPVLVPDRWGYYIDYSVFFWISVCIIAVGLYGLGRLIDRFFSIS
jgi:hypothetical protein